MELLDEMLNSLSLFNSYYLINSNSYLTAILNFSSLYSFILAKPV